MTRYPHALLTLLAACATGVHGGDGPIPGVDYCSPEAAQHACQIDSTRAGSYPPIDQLANAARTNTARPALGCAYAVSLDNELLYLGADGLADNGLYDPDCAGGGCGMGLHHVGAVASVSKTLTAIAVMRLYEMGRIDGDPTTSTVGELLPDAPAALADLTVHQLLSHLSGLGGAGYLMSHADAASLADLYPEVEHPGLHPRIMWYGLKPAVQPDPTAVDEAAGIGNYSNAAFRILGAIVDMHSAYSADEMETLLSDVPNPSQETVGSFWLGGYESFVRSQLNHAGYAYDEKLTTVCQHHPSREPALGAYYAPNFPFSPADPANPVTPADFVPGPDLDALGRRGPSGGWMMTIGDLARLTNGLLAGRFVSPETLDEMRVYRATATGLNLDFGYGLILQSQSFTADPSGTTYPGFMAAGNIGSVGVSAISRIIELPDGRSVGAAMMCNEDISITTMNNALTAMSDQVYTDFIANDGKSKPIAYDADRANCPLNPVESLSPPDELLADYGAPLKEAWAGFLARADNDLATADRLIRAAVGAQPEGAAILRAWDLGDLDAVAELGLSMLWRLERASTDGVTARTLLDAATPADPTGAPPLGR